MLVSPIGVGTQPSSSITFAITTSLASPAGNAIVFALGYVNVNTTATAVDSAGNTYTGTLRTGSNTRGYIFYCLNALALPAGGTITVTFGSAVTIAGMTAVTVSGLTAIDFAGVGATGSSTAPSVSTGSLNQDQEMAFAFVVANGGAADSFAEAASFTSTPRSGGVINATGMVHLAYQAVSATTALTYAPTLSTSRVWVTDIITFEAQGSYPKSVVLSGTSWTVPPDWNSQDNILEVVSAAGNATAGGATSGGGAGGGGGYALTNNVTLTPGASLQIQIGAAGGTIGTSGTGATWINGASVAGSSVGIAGAASGSGTTGGAGALITGAVGWAFPGQSAGAGGSSRGGGGGGGAAGRNGAPSGGVDSASGTSTTGGTGGGSDGIGGAGGTATSAPAAGSAASGNNLSGGSGGGGSLAAGDTAGAAGGGPGAAGGAGYNLGGAGASQGGYAIATYTPLPFNSSTSDTVSAPLSLPPQNTGFVLSGLALTAKTPSPFFGLTFPNPIAPSATLQGFTTSLDLSIQPRNPFFGSVQPNPVIGVPPAVGFVFSPPPGTLHPPFFGATQNNPDAPIARLQGFTASLDLSLPAQAEPAGGRADPLPLSLRGRNEGFVSGQVPSRIPLTPLIGRTDPNPVMRQHPNEGFTQVAFLALDTPVGKPFFGRADPAPLASPRLLLDITFSGLALLHPPVVGAKPFSGFTLPNPAVPAHFQADGTLPTPLPLLIAAIVPTIPQLRQLWAFG